MVRAEPTMEEVNGLLFDDEPTQEKAQSDQPRLLKERGLSSDLEELEPVPYYKRPKVQAAAMIALTFPLGWGLVSAFSPPKQATQPNTPTTDVEDRQNQLLRESLEQERQKNQDLTIDKGLRAQHVEVAPPNTKPTPKPIRQSTSAPPVRQPTPPPPQTVAPRPSPVYVTRTVPTSTYAPRRVSTPAPPKTSPKTVSYKPSQPATVAPVASQQQAQPEPEPMEQWLEQANKGHYVTSSVAGSEAVAQPAVYTSSAQDYRGPAGSYEPSTGDVYDASVPPPDSYPTSAEGSVPDASVGYPSATIPTPVPLGTEAQSTYPAQDIAGVPGEPQYPSQYPSEYPQQSYQPAEVLDIGSSAQAVLETGVAWSDEGLEQNSKHILRLDEGFKNRQGVEVLPRGTYLVAEVTQKSDAGLFVMEVTQIVRSGDRQKLPVQPGALQIMAKDGSPLQASLKKKGGPGFSSDLAAILAPGLEGAMNAVSESADTLLVQDGDRSIVRSNGGGTNPIASAVGGIAEGISRVYGSKLDRTQSRSEVVSYFKFDGGKSVRVFVNEDLAF